MTQETEERILRVIQILVFIVAVVYLIFFKALPDYKKTLGSSDGFINQENYKEIIELNIPDGPDFILILNKENIISNILFLNEKSIILYNKNIERKKLKGSINLIFNNLEENDYIDFPGLSIITYDNYNSNILKTNIKEELTKTYPSLIINETNNDLSNKLKELAQLEDPNPLEQLELYSKEVIRKYKNSLLIEENKNNLTEEEAATLANNIYQKLLNYSQNVKNQDRESNNLPIQLIRPSEDKNIFPSAKSWYYIEDGKVYAYINFSTTNKNYNYCYEGSINSLKKGVC